MSTIDETVSFSLEVNVDKAVSDLHKYETVLYRVLGLWLRMGLPPEIEAQVRYLQRLIAILNQARLAALALQAASGPVGWALAGVGFLTMALSSGELIGDVMYDTQRGGG